MSLFKEAREALEEAREIYGEYLKTEKTMKLRDASEKGWLAMVLATGHLLTCAGAEKPRGRAERNELLEELEDHAAEVKELGLGNRMWARSDRLHALGFYESMISPKSLERELDEVERYLKDVEKLTEVVSKRRKELEPRLREVQKKWIE